MSLFQDHGFQTGRVHAFQVSGQEPYAPCGTMQLRASHDTSAYGVSSACRLENNIVSKVRLQALVDYAALLDLEDQAQLQLVGSFHGFPEDGSENGGRPCTCSRLD